VDKIRKVYHTMDESMAKDYIAMQPPIVQDMPSFSQSESQRSPARFAASQAQANHTSVTTPIMGDTLPWVCVALGIGIYLNFGDNSLFQTFGAFSAVYGIAKVIEKQNYAVVQAPKPPQSRPFVPPLTQNN